MKNKLKCTICGSEYHTTKKHTDKLMFKESKKPEDIKPTKIKCPNCGKELIKLKGKHKIAIQI